jgi:RsiW-degrading membrane proteinase PrsW (M82 family)
VPVAVLALLALACAGCDDHLVGLHDVVIRYALTAPARPPDDLRERVSTRLAAVDITADVTLSGSDPAQVVLRVDDDFAPSVDQLMTWPGGVALAVLEPEGTAEQAGHRVVREPVARGESVHADVRGATRSRAVEWPPLAMLDGAGTTADGPRILIPLSADAEALLLHKNPGVPPDGRPVAVLRDQTVLAVLAPPVVEAHRLVVPIGTSIVAYTIAADLAHLLRTPKLPDMAEVSREAPRPDWTLALENLLLPFAVSFAWLFFVRRFDRAQPEPLWLVFLTFLLGVVAVVPAGIVEWGWDSLSPYTNPTLLTFGRSARAFPLALVGFIVTVGVSEEGAKLLATWSLATHRREFDEPVDGMVYGAAAALGFAAAENVRYLALGRVAGALVASRAFMSVPAHLFFGTIWGFALGRRLVEPERRVWPLFVAAVSFHGLFDALLSTEGGLPWACLVGLVVASIFIVHLRLALRHGAVTPDGLPTAEGPRELFRMGSPGVFAAFVVAMYVLSAAVFFLTLFDHSGAAGVTLTVASAALFALLGWSARGVAASLPLDVVVDDAGVTFAGAAIRYGDVVRIERRHMVGSLRRQEQMVIVGAGRKLLLGPASHETIEALSHALATRLSSVALRS